jgi:hypothetical protein
MGFYLLFAFTVWTGFIIYQLLFTQTARSTLTREWLSRVIAAILIGLLYGGWILIYVFLPQASLIALIVFGLLMTLAPVGQEIIFNLWKSKQETKSEES